LPGSTYAAAYAGEAGAVTRAKAAFDHVLNGQVSLTEKAIVEYAKRNGKAAR
jgi:hypothetical protein